MKGLRRTILKTITTFALVMALAAGVAAGFRGKAQAGNAPGTYTVKLFGKGGEIKYGGVWKTSHSLSWGAGAYLGLPSKAQCRRSGYCLWGFSTNQNATTPTYMPGEVVRVYKDTNFYAVWHKVTIHYYNSSAGGYFLKSDGHTIMEDGVGHRYSQIEMTGGCQTKLLGADRVVIADSEGNTKRFKGWCPSIGGWVDYNKTFYSTNTYHDVWEYFYNHGYDRYTETDFYLVTVWY